MPKAVAIIVIATLRSKPSIEAKLAASRVDWAPSILSERGAVWLIPVRMPELLKNSAVLLYEQVIGCIQGWLLSPVNQSVLAAEDIIIVSYPNRFVK